MLTVNDAHGFNGLARNHDSPGPMSPSSASSLAPAALFRRSQCSREICLSVYPS